jgi:hypothetical protein
MRQLDFLAKDFPVAVEEATLRCRKPKQNDNSSQIKYFKKLGKLLEIELNQQCNKWCPVELNDRLIRKWR